MVLGEVFLHTVLEKSGPELFKELYRLYPLSEVEDYFRNGSWNDAMMSAHYKLIFDHREMAGSPDPPPLSELTFPDLPAASVRLPTTGQVGALTVPKIQEGPAQMGQLMAAALKMAQGGGSQGIAAVAELKSIITFVTKHKLDFAKTGSLIMGMPQNVRKVVMLEFAPKEGTDTVQELTAFIEEKKAATPAESEPTGNKQPEPAGNKQPEPAGTKRPAAAAALPVVSPAAQRPRLMMPGAGVARAPLLPGLVAK
eukprot:TRINITY_DN5644_c0_g1_i1.p1 TRINITY_DN5644_c0_g1~~TRINITY_DN5644_c0_g1_i1.p1  ORF type:complete len:276 (+),score=62.30 TRINITY_DN5644_c0_g1_i1:68-829(+)